MRQKGIPRNLWEGDLSGEGMFRLVKPHVKRGLGQKGIFKSTLNKLYHYREINSMIDSSDRNFHTDTSLEDSNTEDT